MDIQFDFRVSRTFCFTLVASIRMTENSIYLERTYKNNKYCYIYALDNNSNSSVTPQVSFLLSPCVMRTQNLWVKKIPVKPACYINPS